jgi:hypothetical protein
MVKVRLEEEGKTKEHEGECAFVVMLKPTKAPKGCNAVMSIGGEVSMMIMARAIGACALRAIEVMAEGDEGAKNAAVYELLNEIGKDYDE